MASWIVMQPPAQARDTDAALMPDGFALFAFVASPLWLLWHRLWIEAALVIAALVVVAVLEKVTSLAAAAPLLSLLLSIFVGLEGNAMRVAALRRRGWRSWGVLDADDLHDAETRYAAATVTEGIAASDRAPIQPSPNSSGPGSVLGGPVGLLLNPGR